MDRRGFLGGVASAAVAVAGGTALGGGPAAAATRVRPVLLWESVGGFVPAGYLGLRPPQLAVYGDGLIVADATRYAHLRLRSLTAFVSMAADVLGNPANGTPRPGAPVVADIPTTRFSVRRGGRTRSISAEALPETRDSHVYPRPLYALLDTFTSHRDRTVEDGRDFTPSAVRLVVVRVSEPPADVAPWPAGVPVPVIAAEDYTAVRNLYGTAARAAVRGITRQEPWSFTTYRTAGGTLLAAGWRRLLPHER